MKSRYSFRISAIAATLAWFVPAVHAANAPTLPAPRIAFLANTHQSYDSFIVTYRNDSTERGNRSAVMQNINAAVARAGLQRATTSSSGATIAPLTASYQRKLAVGADLIRTSRKLSQTEANALMRQIAADPAVAHVQPNLIMHAVRDIAAATRVAPQTFTPNDPYYAKYQWHFSDPIGGADINNGWDLSNGGGITVAVIDTGITQHPDLDMSLADAGYDFISDAQISGRASDGRAAGGWDLGDWTTTEPYLSECTDAQDPPESSSWHGTHVSGTATELTDNGVGMAGIAYKAKLLPVRVLGHCGGTTADISDAIVWASGGHVDGVPDNQHPAQVINMSLGGGARCSAGSAEAVAIADAISRGTTVVVAAGNSDADAADYTPASCPGVISVAANGVTGKRAFYSNYGKGVTVSAPGGGVYANDASSGTTVDNGFVWSAINDGTTVPTTPNYGGYAGTSQATPHVAGVVAMILSATHQAGLPTPTPDQIKAILTGSARPFPVSEDQPIGAGIVDAYAAINKALDNSNGSGEPAVIMLSKGVILGNQLGAAGASILYAIDVPAGANTLNIRSFGGTGDVSLFVKAGSAPAADGSDADFKSVKPGNNEAVVVAKPQAATYYIRLAAVKTPIQIFDFKNVSVLATYNP